MKPRTPFVVNATTAVCLITGAFYMFLQNFDFITTPIFLATISISMVLLLINNSLGALIDAERFKDLSEEEKKEYLELVKTPYTQRLWKSAFRQSKEEESGEVVVLDHGYDGITELDNSLPKWYVGLFAVTIVYAIVYFIAYSFTDFAHQEPEYDEEYKTQLAAIAEYEKIMPQATIETAEYKEEWVEDGMAIYNDVCKTCHGDGGKGLTGPNQTDDYWINIQEEYNNKEGEFKNIFYTVWFGSKNDLTMRAFGANEELKGNDVVKVSSYLYKLNMDAKKDAEGKSVDKTAKAPQGVLAPWSKAYKGSEASAPAAEEVSVEEEAKSDSAQ